MAETARQVYVISDLHLGGEYPAPGDDGGRGFRICTHADDLATFVQALTRKPRRPPVELVLNGDIIDFLAERDRARGTAISSSWSPFITEPEEAVAKLEEIAARDLAVFEALRSFLSRGHRLVLVLGNHDVELCLPPVRRALRRILDVEDGRGFEFVYDGEAYVVGEALIEHGNRYDMFNVVDFDALRRFRSLISRRQEVGPEYTFVPPAGSKLVAWVINPIKAEYAFIDLLKPEQETVIPLLLALEPGYRHYIAQAALLAREARRHRPEAPARPVWGGEIRAEPERRPVTFGGDLAGAPDAAVAGRTDREAALEWVLDRVLGSSTREFLEETRAEGTPAPAVPGSEIAARTWVDRTCGLAQLLLSRDDARIQRRLPTLLKALRALQGDDPFRIDVETAREYLDAATVLARGSFQCVVFGHTHIARQVPLGDGHYYLNTGTWADTLRFPREILAPPDENALARLRVFVERMKAGDFTDWTLFHPTYVRLNFDTRGRLLLAKLCEYSGSEGVE